MDGSLDNLRNIKLQVNVVKNEGIKVLVVGVGGYMFKDEFWSIVFNFSKVFIFLIFGILIMLVFDIMNLQV